MYGNTPYNDMFTGTGKVFGIVPVSLYLSRTHECSTNRLQTVSKGKETKVSVETSVAE